MVKKSKRTVVVRPPPSRRKRKEQQEITRLGAALRSLGSLGGSAVGGLVGMPSAGSSVGHNLGAALSRWLGSGDYEVSRNSLVTRASTGIPAMHKTDQKIVVRHREFVGEVRSATSFTVQSSYSINPGLTTTFPWLSRVASVYQTYAIKGMVWHYVPTSGSAISGTNNALGSVMLQTSYRANDSPPSSKSELLNEYWSCESVPSESFCHPIECAPKENPFQVQYIRNMKVPEGDNVLLYDLGVTHVAVSGMQANDVVVGDLWVTYEIELSKPMVSSNVTSESAMLAQLSYNSPTTGDVFGAQTANTGNIPISVSNRTITIPRGYWGTFYFYVIFTGSGLSGVNMTGAVSGLSNCAVFPIFDDGVNLTNRFEMNVASASGSGATVFATGIVKNNRDAVAAFTLPPYTATIGPTTTRLLVYGVQEL